VPVSRVREIQELNRKGIKPEKLIPNGEPSEVVTQSHDLLSNDSLTRFDAAGPKNQKRRYPHKRKNRKPDERKNK
jgi:hypothetical protein